MARWHGDDPPLRPACSPGLGFDRFGRGRFDHWRLLHGFCDRGDGFNWRCNDRRRFQRFRLYHHRLGVERHWRDSLRRFDNRCFGDRLLRRWLDGCWRDNFRSINDQRLGGRYRLDDYRLSGYWFHGSRLDGDRRSGNGFNDGNRGRYGLDSFRDAGVLNLNLFRLLILRTNHRVADQTLPEAISGDAQATVSGIGDWVG